MSEARDWEVSGVVFEWGSGDVGKKGGAAEEKSTGTMAGPKITTTIVSGKTVEKAEVI